MTNEQILKKAIEKAIGNGWKEGGLTTYFMQKMGCSRELVFGVIFSHSFAKSFWGEKEVMMQSSIDFAHGSGAPMPEWKYNLIVMVQQEEPLKYLERFLEG